MNSIEKIISHIRIPRMVRVKQHFNADTVADIPVKVRNELSAASLDQRVKKGERVAITAGSRGIANIPLILKEIVSCVRAAGGEPFIVPTMGSHGGATAQGQTKVLEELGITEESTGAPIRATMDVVQLGVTENGLPIKIDRYAHLEADSIIVVGRVKPHTSFRATYESGLAKMISVGLGKRDGAEVCHAAGIWNVPVRVEELARATLERANIIMAVGIVENAYDETHDIFAVPGEQIMDREPEILDLARQHMPEIMISSCDVVVIDEAGKNIAGTGMDPNIIRRNYVHTVEFSPLAQRIAVLDLTREAHGNANGMANADVCSRRFFDKFDMLETYVNPLTNGILESVKIPVVMDNDKLAIQAAIKGCFNLDFDHVKMVRIKNTLKVGEIMVSENLLDQVREHPDLEILSKPFDLVFDENGNLL